MTQRTYGLVRGPDLAPRDSAPPRVVAVDPAAPVLSPNDDDVADTATLTARLSEPADWRIRVRDAEGATLHESTGSGNAADGDVGRRSSTARAAGGRHVRLSSSRRPTRGRTPARGAGRSGSTRPARPSSAVSPAEGSRPLVRPERRRRPRDRRAGRDDVRTRLGRASTSATSSGDARALVQRPRPVAAARSRVTWDGKATDGRVVADGDYEVRFTPQDAARQRRRRRRPRGPGSSALLGFVTSSKIVFHPHDGDTLATGDAPVVHAGPAGDRDLDDPERQRRGRRDAARRRRAGGRRHRPATTTARRVGGAAAARALHVVRGRRRRAPSTARQAASFEMNAVRHPALGIVGDARPLDHALGRLRRGAVDGAPASTSRNPGKPRGRVTFTRVTSLTYRATLRLKTGGAAGSVAFRVAGDRLAAAAGRRPHSRCRCASGSRGDPSGRHRTTPYRSRPGPSAPCSRLCRGAYRQRSELPRYARARPPTPPVFDAAPLRVRAIALAAHARSPSASLSVGRSRSSDATGRHGRRGPRTGHPLGAGAGPRGRPDRVHAGRAGLGRVQAAGRGPLDRRRRGATGAARRAARRQADPGAGTAPRPSSRAGRRPGSGSVDPTATAASWSPRATQPVDASTTRRARRAPAGCRREVFGFLPYWQVELEHAAHQLRQDLDDRLLRRRRRRGRQPPEAQQRRLDDRRAGAAGRARS